MTDTISFSSEDLTKISTEIGNNSQLMNALKDEKVQSALSLLNNLNQESIANGDFPAGLGWLFRIPGIGMLLAALF